MGNTMSIADGYALTYRIPSMADYLRLREEAGLTPRDQAAANAGLPNSFIAVVIEHEGEAIGIVALSLGGMVALDWLAHDPQRVHRAILINSSSANCPLWWRIQPRALPLLVRGVFAPSIDSQERWALRMVSNQHSEDASVLNRHKQLRAQHPAQKSNVLRQLWAASRFRAPAKLAPHQRLHLLASHGDRMVSWRCSNALAERFNCSLDVHPNAGHDLPLDAPDWVIQQFAAQQ